MLPGIWEHFTLTFVLSHQGRGDFAPLAGRCVSLPILLSFVSEDAGTRPCRGSGGISPSPSSSPIEVEDILPPLRGGKKCRTPPAGSLRVSLNSSFSPQEWGIKGVERRFIRQPPSGRHICWIPCQAWNDILCGHYDDTIPAWFAAQVMPCHNLRQGCRGVVSHTVTNLRRSQLSEENTSA